MEADHLIKLWEEEHRLLSSLWLQEGGGGTPNRSASGTLPPIPLPIVNSGSDKGGEHPSIIPPPVRPSHNYGLSSSPVPGTMLFPGGMMVD